MAQWLQIAATGLHTNNSEFADSPPGALIRAENVEVRRKNVLEPRRGLQRISAQFSGTTNRALNLFEYGGKLLSLRNTGKLAYFDEDAGSWVDYTGTFTAPDVTVSRMHAALAQNNFYFPTDAGLMKLDSVTGTPAMAGVPRAIESSVVLTEAEGFLAQDNQVAYRVLWGIRDANNNLLYGAPSGRITIANPTATAATRDVVHTIPIPDGITTSHFFQVYRSAASGGDDIEPSDELGLVYEANPTSGEITAGEITFTDNTPGALIGTNLYTNPTEEGELQANNTPPVGTDIAFFNGFLFLSNTTSKQRKTLTLISASEITEGDKITVTRGGDSFSLTAAAAEDTTAGEFLLATDGTAAQNIANTTKSILRCINQYASNTFLVAYYLSGANDLPGIMQIEEKDILGDEFSFTFDGTGNPFNPSLPSTGTGVRSSAESKANRVAYSKYFEPEAFPLLNYFNVGSENFPILRIFPLTRALLVFKGDGVYRVTGDSAPFSVELLDSSVVLLAADSCAVLDSKIFCLTTQGVAAVSETGIQIVSQVIEDKFQDLFSNDIAAVKRYSWGVGYEVDRKYLLYTISKEGETRTTQAWVYNALTNAWTQYKGVAGDIGCGMVRQAEQVLYLAANNSKYVYKERKTSSYRDYIDDEIAVTVTAVNGTVLTLSDISDIKVGDLYYQSASIYSTVSALSKKNSTITLTDTRNYTAGARNVYKAIDVKVSFARQACGNLGELKQFREIEMAFKSNYFTGVGTEIGFSTDQSGSSVKLSVEGQRTSWGLFPWGGVPWGGAIKPVMIRTLVPLEQQYAYWLEVNFSQRLGYSSFEIIGLNYTIETLEGSGQV